MNSNLTEWRDRAGRDHRRGGQVRLARSSIGDLDSNELAKVNEFHENHLLSPEIKIGSDPRASLRSLRADPANTNKFRWTSGVPWAVPRSSMPRGEKRGRERSGSP